MGEIRTRSAARGMAKCSCRIRSTASPPARQAPARCLARSSTRRLSSSPLTRRGSSGWQASHRKALDKALIKAARVVKRTVEATTGELTSELQEALKS
jgi:hypothetical protein